MKISFSLFWGRIIFLVAGISGTCLLTAQTTTEPQQKADPERVNNAYRTLNQLVIPLPERELPCPFDLLISEQKEMSNGKPDLAFWLNEVKKMRDQGDQTCCFKLLKTLEPLAKNNTSDQLNWLFELSKTLHVFEYEDSALVISRELQQLARQYHQFQGWANITEAWAMHGKRQFEETLRLAEEAITIARKENDQKLEATALGIIGRVSRDIYMIKPDKNVPFHLQALNIEKNLRDTNMIISELVSIGMSYSQTPRLDLEFESLVQAVALITPQTTLGNRMNCLRLMGSYLHETGDIDRALPMYEQSIRMSKKLGYKGMCQNTYEQVAGIYFAKKNYDKSLEMMDSAKAYSDFKRELGFFYRSYAEIAEAKGDLPLAVKYYQKAFAEQVKGYTNRNSSLLTEFETKFRTREKEILIDQQRRQRWLLLGLALALALLLAGAVYAYFNQKKGKLEIINQKALIEKQSEELRQLDKMKSHFFANVSHELRTPLTLMLGPIGSALKSNTLDNRNFTLLKLAQTHGAQLLKLINEILDLSKLQAGKLELYETIVPFFTLVRRISSAFESYAERQNIRFSFQFKAEKNLQIEIDVSKFETILNNLLSNALKFTSAGGKVSVIVEDLGSHLQILVSDTGRGIHPDDLPHIFDRFYQSSLPGAPVEGGTGIGLALCTELSNLMKGRLWAESEPGKGSRFYFEFPRKEVFGSSAHHQEPITEELQSAYFVPLAEPVPAPALPTLLVVEDNSSLRDFLQLILSEHHNVVTAENGKVALDMLSMTAPTFMPELILSDVMMPVMDGFQLLDQLKSDDRWRHIPVVMLTARADIQDKLRALRIGVDDYLLKPFVEDELLARVENLLHNARGRQLEIVGEKGEEQADTVSLQSFLPSEEEQDWLSKLEKTVEHEINNENFKADALAEAMLMSRTRFFQQLKRLTGITPNEYILEVRFRKARTLLETQKVRSIKELSYAVGFRDVDYFSKQFKTRFGKSPSEYV